jgi:hypothetical protein
MLRLIGYWELPEREIAQQMQYLRAELARPNLSGEARASLQKALEKMERLGNFIHPRRLVDPSWPPEQRRRCIDYLRHGAVWMSFLGFSYCRFRCGVPAQEMGCSTLTDGVWAWPEGLAHYVERHAVRLPEDFIAHIDQNFAMPSDLTQRTEDPSRCETSLEFWVEWSRRAAQKT